MSLGRGVLSDLQPEVRTYINQLEQQTDELTERNQKWAQQYEALKEAYLLLTHHRFGRSSEQSTDMGELFGGLETAEEKSAIETEGDSIEVCHHRRKKRGRKPIDENIPRIEILHDIAEEDKKCACGNDLGQIGVEVDERLQVIPEQFYVEKHVYPRYACKRCEGSGDEEKAAVRVAPREKTIIAGSIATSGLLAFILVNKFCDHLPFYRQEKRFERIGVRISRQDMSNWTIAAYERVKPLIKLMRSQLLSGPLIQMDETPVQVMGEPGRSNTAKSYMWLARGGPPEAPVTLYSYRESRAGKHPREFLEGYEGYLQTDGYDAYDSAFKENKKISQVGCFAHSRRKFHEASKATKKKVGSAEEGLKYINQLFRIERDLRGQGLSDDVFVEERKKLAQPVLEKFHRWLNKKSNHVLPGSLLGKAVGYTLRQWKKLVRYLEAPYLRPDNNGAERAIRPFVCGRKNWLFSGSPTGADASCAIYSLIETARQNGLDPYAYLYYLFEQIPTLEGGFEQLLPSNIDHAAVKSAFLKQPVTNIT
jgi:transposase